METKEPQLNKTYPEGTVFTMLKFELSEKDNKTYIGFVSQDTKTGEYYGRRANDKYPKKICIVDAALNFMIIPGVLYRCTLVPMKEKKGFIVIEATPYQFKATIKTSYIPRCLYQIEVKFGQKTLIFDPKDGRKESVRTVSGFVKELSKRLDIENISDVIRDFEYSASELMSQFANDGYYVKAQRV